ncbi:MAG: protein kinase [Rhodopirellula sp.]|nr:protein kinase [Rhodopirellula sp.]
MTAATCPNRQTLLGYLTGTIPYAIAEGVAEHLNHCARCEQTVRELETHGDTVMAALRQPARNDAPAAVPELQRVLKRLHQMKLGTAEPAASHGSSAAAEEPRQVPTLGDYELLKKLGQGGMGTVYKARHKKLKRIVALKVLPKDRLRNAEAVARFEREMEAVGRLDHPHIVRATDAREIGGVHFLVMEYVEGFDLAQIVGRCGALSIADACEVIRQAALGLQCSHENGLVHRDVKPSNLMLTTAGEVKVLDLGLAQIQQSEGMSGDVTGIGRIMGTPDYISPEQASDSHSVDIRTDIYSLGCSLYHLLAGHPPFTGPKYDSPMKRVTAHIYEEIPPIEFVRKDVPKPVAALIARMLAKDVQTRPQTPSAVVDALAVFCEGSKLIGLLREARQQGSPDSDQGASHVNTGELRASAEVETSRDASPMPPGELPEGEPLDFDPYHRWLAIPPSEQPPNRYRLLGLAIFENDREVIRDAAARQMAHVRTYHLGQHAELSQRILNELAAAKIFLLAPEKKAAYDAELRKGLSAAAVEPPPPPESPVQEQTVPEQAVRETAEEKISVVVQLRRQAARFGSAIAKLREPATRGKAWLRTPPGITTMIASSLTALVLGAVIAIETNYGTVKIEIAEGISGVEVKLDGETISIEGLDHLLRIRPGEHELSVVSEGFETYCRSFTVKRGGNPALAVTLVPLVGKTAITPSESIASTAAEHELPPRDQGDGGGADRVPNGSTGGVVEATEDISQRATMEETAKHDPVRWVKENGLAFVRMPDGTWQEEGENDARYLFTETRRTTDFVELAGQTERWISYRLFADRAMISRNSGPFSTEYNGRWEGGVGAIPESRHVDKMGAAEAHPISSSPARHDDSPEPRLPANSLTPAEVEDHWQLLFDGKSLNGWSGSSQYYTVENVSVHFENWSLRQIGNRIAFPV